MRISNGGTVRKSECLEQVVNDSGASLSLFPLCCYNCVFTEYLLASNGYVRPSPLGGSQGLGRHRSKTPVVRR